MSWSAPKHCLAVLLLLCFGCAALAADTGRFQRGLLFRVEPPSGGGAPSYLFGTIHSEDLRVVDLPAPVEQAFHGADVFVMEVIPDSAAIAESTSAMTFSDGRTLADVLPEPLYDQTVSALGQRGMSEAVIKHFKPWAAMLLLSVPEGKTGQFLDVRLYASAGASGKQVLGLETMHEQLGVFDDLAETEQIGLLRETVERLDELPQAFEDLVEAYRDRDLAKLLRLSEKSLQQGAPGLAKRFREAAIDSRNRHMAERILPLLDHGGHFIAVGALHLPGEGGLLERISAEGYEISPVY